MHYRELAFAIDKRRPTIEVIYRPFPLCVKDLGQRHGLSFKDKVRVNLLYSCEGEMNNN